MRATGMTRMCTLVAVGTLIFSGCGGDDDDGVSQKEIEDAVADGNLDPDEIEDLSDDIAEEGGDDDSGDNSGEGSDACAVLTQDDAEALFGVAAQLDDDSVPVGLGSSCVWENADADELGSVGHLVQLQLYEGDQFYSESVYPDAEPLDGLGDRAFIVGGPSSLAGPTIGFQKGNTVGLFSYTVINIGVDEADQVDPESREADVIELAHTIVDRL
ncbi:MAG: hypothetical protein ACT4OX_08460 [Actinomycetota bacterium]